MPPGTLRINDMDFILNGPHVKYKSSSLPKTEKSKFKENTEFRCCGYCLLLSLKKVMVKKKFPPSFFSQWNTYLKVFSANQI